MDKVNFNKFKSSNPNLPDGANPPEEPNTETIWNYGPGKLKVEGLQNYAIFNNVQNYARANGYEITYKDNDRKQYFGTELYSAFINSKANKRDNYVIDEEELKKFLELKAKEAESPEKTDLLNSFIVKRAKDINIIDNSTAGLGFNEKASGDVSVNNFYVKINKGTKVQLKKVLKSKGLEIPNDDYSAYVIMNLLSTNLNTNSLKTSYADIDGNIREISEAEIDRFVQDIKTKKTLSVKRAGVTDALYNLACNDGKDDKDKYVFPIENSTFSSPQKALELELRLADSAKEKAKAKIDAEKLKAPDKIKQDVINKKIAEIEAIEKDKVLIGEKLSTINTIKNNRGVNSLEQLKFLYNDDKLVLNRTTIDIATNKETPREVDYSISQDIKDNIYGALTHDAKTYDQLAVNKLNALLGYSFTLEKVKTGEVIELSDGKIGEKYTTEFIVKEDKSLIKPKIELKKEDFEFGVKLEGNTVKIIETKADKIAPKLNLGYYKN